MYTLTCKLCGKEFQSNRPNRKYCKDPHYFTCPVCGQQFNVDRNRTYYEGKQGTACCCRKCARIFSEANMSDDRKQKRRNSYLNTMKEKYGVENPGQLSSVLEKRKLTNLQKYGTEYANQSDEVKQRTKETNLRKYGVECTLQNDEVKAKSKQTLLDRYGSDNISGTEHFKNKVKETSEARYGTEYPIQSDEVKAKIRTTNLQRYGAENPFGNKEVQAKASDTKISRYGRLGPTKEQLVSTFRDRYGVDWYTQTDEYKDKVKETSLRNYGTEHFLSSEQVKERRTATCLQRYGVDNVGKSEEVKQRIRETFIRKYGFDSPLKIPDIRRKQVTGARNSKLEVRVANLLDNYNIEYVQQFVVSKEGHIHAFDFYIPKYRILLDADGKYYHSYLSDPDGKFVRDDYDEVRAYLIPEDHIFVLAVEGEEERAVKRIYEVIKGIDTKAFDCDTSIFSWCRSVGFPYPSYSDSRMRGDWNRLCEYQKLKYTPQCRLGISIVKNFHKSIYDARVGNNVSVKEAWYDDEKLRRVISNRFIYRNSVDPSKVLQGFNISKIGPTVSLFNPVLAKYLTEKYLPEFSEVFDPFSGFSGRLLGVTSTGRRYIGQDIDIDHVEESEKIRRFLELTQCCEISVKDILNSWGTYQSLLTCPPYGTKEVYGQESEYHSCDEWIQICLSRFKCRRYVFIVDKTAKFKDNVAERVENSSHFNKNCEYVVVVDR